MGVQEFKLKKIRRQTLIRIGFYIGNEAKSNIFVYYLHMTYPTVDFGLGFVNFRHLKPELSCSFRVLKLQCISIFWFMLFILTASVKMVDRSTVNLIYHFYQFYLFSIFDISHGKSYCWWSCFRVTSFLLGMKRVSCFVQTNWLSTFWYANLLQSLLLFQSKKSWSISIVQ